MTKLTQKSHGFESGRGNILFLSFSLFHFFGGNILSYLSIRYTATYLEIGHGLALVILSMIIAKIFHVAELRNIDAGLVIHSFKQNTGEF